MLLPRPRLLKNLLFHLRRHLLALLARPVKLCLNRQRRRLVQWLLVRLLLVQLLRAVLDEQACINFMARL